MGEGGVGLCGTLGGGGDVEVVLGEEGSVEWLGSFKSDESVETWRSFWGVLWFLDRRQGGLECLHG